MQQRRNPPLRVGFAPKSRRAWGDANYFTRKLRALQPHVVTTLGKGYYWLLSVCSASPDVCDRCFPDGPFGTTFRAAATKSSNSSGLERGPRLLSQEDQFTGTRSSSPGLLARDALGGDHLDREDGDKPDLGRAQRRQMSAGPIGPTRDSSSWRDVRTAAAGGEAAGTASGAA